MLNVKYFFTALVVTFAVAQPLAARALYKRVLAWECRPKSTTNSVLKYDTAGINQSSAASGQTPVAFCPYPSDPDLPHGSVSSIGVNVVDTTTGAGSVFVVKACLMRLSPDTLNCGTSSSNPTATGDYTISPSVSAWTNAANSSMFPYVNVTFPASTTPGSELRGIIVQ